jgi:hypothetical protein
VLYHADNVIQFISELSRIDGWLKYTVQFPKRGSMADANPTAGSMLSSVHAHPVHDRDHEDDHLRHTDQLPERSYLTLGVTQNRP